MIVTDAKQASFKRIREACILLTGADKDADVLIQGLQVDEAKNGWQKIAFYYKVEKKQVTAHLDNVVE